VSNPQQDPGDLDGDRPRLRQLATNELTLHEIAVIRAILVVAFGPGEDERFTDDDWSHALGGRHFVLDLDGEPIAHGSVVERELHLGERAFRTGYVEAVATAPGHQGRGFGSLLVTEVSEYVRANFEIGGLGTGRHHFYERLGWQTWLGPSFVRTADGLQSTPDDDGYILVLPTPSNPSLDLTEPISCEWRPGDAW
jgi:aminoglycoside 2'-N-acetyltransferase I